VTIKLLRVRDQRRPIQKEKEKARASNICKEKLMKKGKRKGQTEQKRSS
jgi:hypothetical protein